MGNEYIPKVSVIVPTYNAGEFLHRCIDSLIYQTLDEIEILIIDNCSTDNTWKIMKDYECRFPEKVRIFQLDTHTNGPGAGRNCGLEHARAEYIGFADSDDYFEYHALECMYQKAISENCDLIYVTSYDVRETDYKKTRNLPTGSREEILTIGSMVFWNKLVHKSLFEKVGKVPEDMVFEDLAYCTGLVSYAKKIGYIDEPLYYYVIREDSGVNTMDPERVLKSIKAEEIALSLCNPEYLDYFADSVAMRNCNNIRDRWQFTDSYIEQLLNIKPYLISNKYFKSDQRNYPRVQKYYQIANEFIPRILYVNDFGTGIDETFIQILKEKAFWNDSQLYLMNEDNCNIEENAFVLEAYQKQEYEKVAQYFALKQIYENGGIYLDSCIEIDNPLNFVLHLDVFFSYLDKDTFSDKIFGAVKKNEIIYKIINTYSKSLKGYVTFSERVKEVLVVCCGMNLDGKTNIYNKNASVFGPEVFVINKGSRLHMTCHNFKQKLNDEEYITVKRSSLT